MPRQQRLVVCGRKAFPPHDLSGVCLLLFMLILSQGNNFGLDKLTFFHSSCHFLMQGTRTHKPDCDLRLFCYRHRCFLSFMITFYVSNCSIERARSLVLDERYMIQRKISRWNFLSVLILLSLASGLVSQTGATIPSLETEIARDNTSTAQNPYFPSPVHGS